MNNMDRTQLADMLGHVSQHYFDGMPVETSAGICFALHEMVPDGDPFNPYHSMNGLMKEMREPMPIYGEYTDSRKKWEPRAWMCLFLVEYLKGEQQ